MKKNAAFPAIVLLILLCLIGPLSSARAETQGVATVIAIRGPVVAKNKSGTERTLSIKSQVFQDDVLKTDKSGQLQIMFTDNSIISLGRDSEMKIAEYRWQPNQKDGALKTQVKEGTFRVMGGALAKDAPQNFKTETPTATIGIRGSMYAGKSTMETLSVVFQGGRGIEVFNDLGRVTITTPGFGTHVVLNAPPAPPSRFTEQELKNLNQGLNGNDGSSGEDSGEKISTAPTPLTVPAPPPLPPVNEYPSAPFNPFALSTNAIINTNFIATYAGQIQASYTYNSAVTPLTGAFAMTANFSQQSIDGWVTFNQMIVPPMYMTGVNISATPTSNSFSATISGTDVSGSLKGAFYGPAAEVVKGDFSATGTGAAAGAAVSGTFDGTKLPVIIDLAQ